MGTSSPRMVSRVRLSCKRTEGKLGGERWRGKGRRKRESWTNRSRAKSKLGERGENDHPEGNLVEERREAGGDHEVLRDLERRNEPK